MLRAPEISLSPDEKKALAHMLSATTTQRRQFERAQIILAAADGKSNESIALELGCSRGRVGKWRARFAECRLPGITEDAPRPGRPAKVRKAVAQAVVEKTTRETPEDHTHWSTRVLAKAIGVSHRPLYRASGACVGAVSGRENTNSSPGSYTTRFAFDAWS